MNETQQKTQQRSRHSGIISRMRIGTKLTGGFLLVLVMLAIVSGVGLLQLMEVNDQATIITDNWLPSARLVEQVATVLEKEQRATYQHIASPDLAQMQEAEKAITEGWSELSKLGADYEKLINSEEERSQFKEVSQQTDRFKVVQDRIISLSRQNENDAARQLAAGEGRTVFNQLSTTLGALEKLNAQGANAANQHADEVFAQARILIIALALVALVAGLAMAYSLTRAIVQPIRQTAQVAERMAGGDLTVNQLPIRSHDEIGEMGQAINAMISSLRTLLREVDRSASTLTESSEQLATTSSQVSQASTGVAQAVEQVAQGATGQASSVKAATQTVEELRRAIDQIATGAQDQAKHAQETSSLVNEMMEAIGDATTKAENVATSSQQALDSATRGGSVVTKSTQGMERIRSAVADSARHMKELSTLSGQIGEITNVITEIANQTNLLALNAAIEAARAGEHGKGFAVVADEVRKLAERAGSSAKEIADLIEEIQRGTADAVESMSVGQLEVEQGSQLAAETALALNEIGELVQRTAGDAASITAAAQRLQASSHSTSDSVQVVAAITEENTAATEQMAAGSEQVLQSVGQIASISQENAAAAEEVSASVEEMNASTEEIASSAQALLRVAAELKEQIDHFRL